MIFILFDVDAAFLYPWALVFRDLGWFGFFEMAIFIGVLCGGRHLRVEGGRARLVAPILTMEFTPENKAEVRRALTRYPVKRSALMPTLALAQEQEGWLHGEAMEYVASLLGLSPAQVHDTASYYTMFAFEPRARPSSRCAPPFPAP